jgi:predicted nucleic acid-binding Zn ribbon protein
MNTAVKNAALMDQSIELTKRMMGAMNCPKCKVDMVRVFSAVGLVFKGEGWAGKTK